MVFYFEMIFHSLTRTLSNLTQEESSMNNNVAILKSLSWRSIPSKIGNLGKAELPEDMTIEEAQSLLNTTLKLDGQDYQVGSIQSFKGAIQVTTFPANSNG
jgi:hypothetical protein